MKHISRIDQPSKGTFGYYVRKQGVAKFFSDKKHGGKEIALQKARVYRNKLTINQAVKKG